MSGALDIGVRAQPLNLDIAAVGGVDSAIKETNTSTQAVTLDSDDVPSSVVAATERGTSTKTSTTEANLIDSTELKPTDAHEGTGVHTSVLPADFDDMPLGGSGSKNKTVLNFDDLPVGTTVSPVVAQGFGVFTEADAFPMGHVMETDVGDSPDTIPVPLNFDDGKGRGIVESTPSIPREATLATSDITSIVEDVSVERAANVPVDFDEIPVGGMNAERLNVPSWRYTVTAANRTLDFEETPVGGGGSDESKSTRADFGEEPIGGTSGAESQTLDFDEMPVGGESAGGSALSVVVDIDELAVGGGNAVVDSECLQSQFDEFPVGRGAGSGGTRWLPVGDAPEKRVSLPLNFDDMPVGAKSEGGESMSDFLKRLDLAMVPVSGEGDNGAGMGGAIVKSIPYRTIENVASDDTDVSETKLAVGKLPIVLTKGNTLTPDNTQAHGGGCGLAADAESEAAANADADADADVANADVDVDAAACADATADAPGVLEFLAACVTTHGRPRPVFLALADDNSTITTSTLQPGLIALGYGGAVDASAVMGILVPDKDVVRFTDFLRALVNHGTARTSPAAKSTASKQAE
jgi:hypothetical protein